MPKRNRAADRHLVASREAYEVAHVAKKFGVSSRTVRAIRALVGPSRRKVYAELRRQGR